MRIVIELMLFNVRSSFLMANRLHLAHCLSIFYFDPKQIDKHKQSECETTRRGGGDDDRDGEHPGTEKPLKSSGQAYPLPGDAFTRKRWAP